MRFLNHNFFYIFSIMEEGNLAILVDAKLEYTKQLVHILRGNIYKGIRRLYNDSKEFCI